MFGFKLNEISAHTSTAYFVVVTEPNQNASEFQVCSLRDDDTSASGLNRSLSASTTQETRSSVSLDLAKNLSLKNTATKGSGPNGFRANEDFETMSRMCRLWRAVI